MDFTGSYGIHNNEPYVKATGNSFKARRGL